MNTSPGINDYLGKKQYITEKQINTEGNFVNYKATEVLLGRTVIITTLNSDKIQQDNTLNYKDLAKEFQEKAQKITQLSHHNIETIYDFLQNDTTSSLFLVREYINTDNTLKEEIKKYENRKQYMPKGKALKYINQIADALEYLQQKNIVYRDIKPENIIIKENQDQVVLIIDIDQIVTGDNDQSDKDYIYYLAEILYYMLHNSSAPPLQDRIKAEQQGRDLLKDNKKYENPNISKSVKTAIEKGLQIKSRERHKSIKSFQNSLPQKSQDNSIVPKKQHIKLLIRTAFTSVSICLALSPLKITLVTSVAGVYVLLGIAFFVFSFYLYRKNISNQAIIFQITFSFLANWGIYIILNFNLFPIWVLAIIAFVLPLMLLFILLNLI